MDLIKRKRDQKDPLDPYDPYGSYNRSRRLRRLRRLRRYEQDDQDHEDYMNMLSGFDDDFDCISSDDELILGIIPGMNQSQHGGSRPGKRPNVDRNRVGGHEQLIRDYFGYPDRNPPVPPLFTDEQFCRRFRITRELFLRIRDDLMEHDVYFTQRSDAFGKRGLSPEQKMFAAFRQLAYGTPADASEEYGRLSETAAHDSLRKFCSGVVSMYESIYLREPTDEDVCRLLAVNSARGFPGMLGSLDCMHWKWNNCPTAWSGQYAGAKGSPTVILEAVASQDLWIWHAFFGTPGSCNDINVFDRSHLFDRMIRGESTILPYTINNNIYKHGYYLADGIYPKYSTIVQSFPPSHDEKKSLFIKTQEACRKDVERAFGVLQIKWQIMKNPSRLWTVESMTLVIKTCIILHNMMVESNRGSTIEEPSRPSENEDEDIASESLSVQAQLVEGQNNRLNSESGSDFLRHDDQTRKEFIQRIHQFRELWDKDRYFQLRNDLIEHIWSLQKDTNS